MSSTSIHDDPVDPIDELLVSYLDGELDEQERSQLEDRLIAEKPLRNRLSELQSGWEMLDLLPPANVNENFARTTVELVAATESTILQSQNKNRTWKRIGWFTVVGVVCVACALVGYAIPVRNKNVQYSQQLALLPLAEHLDAYLVNIDLNIVAQLANDRTWQESMQLANEAGGITTLTSLELDQREPAKRLDVIKNASRDAQVQLATNWERLQALSDTRLKKVRERADAIRDMQNPTLLLKTLDQYARWWQQLSPRTQDLIINAEGARKLEVIQQEVRRSSRRWVRNFAVMLGESDRIPIQHQLMVIADDRIREAKRLTESLADRGLLPFDPKNAPRWWNITSEQLLDLLANRPPFTVPPSSEPTPDDGRRIFQVLFSPLNDLELAMIEDLLSRQALAILYAESDSPEARRETLANWCMELVQQMSPSSNSFDDLLNRYLISDEDRRESLDLSQPDRIISELRGRRGPGLRRNP